ncbi:hypothetical protein SAY86_007334 [Trapa natans]|uniref:Uncharacterized protein n=1 Tax=Trapa natans TaxID=22666 RepID=A0AAN7R0C3_TRANT|nr:hypothetical protein SAY86_007334 [Trapa natans]
MKFVLSLDDGRWLHPTENIFPALMNEAREDHFKHVTLRQPSPPSYSWAIAVRKCYNSSISSGRPKTWACKTLSTYFKFISHLHVYVNMMEDFLRLARGNTIKNLETCGILVGFTGERN